jgi:ABC-type transport system substrate-binding protein
MFSRRWYRTGLIGLLLFTLAGCTTGRNRSASTSPGSDARTLRFALGNDLDSLDPAKTADVGVFEVLLHVCEPLINYDENNKIVPVLAERWEVSPDGKTYTFYLKKGVKFHNGLPFTAEDVKYTFERALNKKTASPLGTAYLEGIVGEQDVVSGKRDDLTGVKVVDPLTVQVTLDRPRAYFLGMLTQQTGFIICKDAVQKNGGVVDTKSLIGTGPFMLDSYQPGQSITLKANPDFRDGKPMLDRIEFPIIVNPETAYNNYQAGTLDVCFGTLGRYAQDKQAGKLTGDYHLLRTAQFPRLVMNSVKQPIFANKLVRQAFAMAIDRADINRVAYKGVGTIRNGGLSAGVPGADPEPPAIPYDPTKAKALLAQAGYPGGKGFPTLTMAIRSNSQEAANAGQMVCSNLHDNLGINVDLAVREPVQVAKEIREKRVEFYFTNWVDYPDPHAFLSAQFISTSDQNYSGYRDPEFDRLSAEADTVQDPAKRGALYSQANHVLIDDVGVIPSIELPRILLVRPNVKGWQYNLIGLLPLWRVTK